MSIYRGIAVFPRDGRKHELVEGTPRPGVDLAAEAGGSLSAQTLIDTREDGMDGRLVWTSTLHLVTEAAEVKASTPRGEVLREAEGLITGERNKNYGSPTENFDTTAALWNAQMGHKLKPGESFTGTDVALLMIQLKMARLKTSPGKRDHYLDVAGYIACAWECQEVEDASA